MTSGLPQIRIQLVDHHAMVRAGLRLLIDGTGRSVVVAEAGTAAEAVAAARREQPDMILLDLDLGPDDGLDCIPTLRRAAPAARLLVVTGVRDIQRHLQAMRLGAVGVLVKDHAPEFLLRAIERVHAGESWLDRIATASLLAELADGSRRVNVNPDQAQVDQLTGREREIVALVAQGLRNRQIAERLRVSEATVRHHLTSIFDKLRVTDRLTLVIFAIRHGLSHFDP